jgi:hypothetical protein
MMPGNGRGRPLEQGGLGLAYGFVCPLKMGVTAIGDGSALQAREPGNHLLHLVPHQSGTSSEPPISSANP